MDKQHKRRVLLVLQTILFCAVTIEQTVAAANDPSRPPPFRFSSSSFNPPPAPPPPFDLFPSPSTSLSQPPRPPTTSNNSNGSSSLSWQPLPLRATFRPMNRQTLQPQPPAPPLPPSPPAPPSSIVESTGFSNLISGDSAAPAPANLPPNSEFPFPSSRSRSPLGANSVLVNSFAPSFSTSTTPKPLVRSAATDGFSSDFDELPTRQPLSRFRPTRAPADDEDSPVSPATGGGTVAPTLNNPQPPSSILPPSTLFNLNNNNSTASSPPTISRITSECYECICEASTSCNANSRCQTSDVRHTRCGMFLISYEQWQATGLSRELVTREQSARDPAADERAFYECVTQRDCAERLMSIYFERNTKDCDRDGRIDCYDLAAIHHSGLEQCASETLLDSQYWGDFNACLGFGRR